MTPTNSINPSRRWPLTLWLGLAMILIAQTLLFNDVRISNRGILHTQQQVDLLPVPTDGFTTLARWVAINMTAIAWTGFMFFMEGLLRIQDGIGPVRRRPHHFAFLFLASVFVWCVFDAINFNMGMRAWHYIGMPAIFADRAWGYFLAFGAIVPGMLMSGQALMNWGVFDWARTPKWHMPTWGLFLSLLVGVAMLIWPLVHHDPVTNLTLWTSLVFLLDPINYWLGRPSMFRDWENGWLGRTLACFAGGAICGLLWEFWNLFAVAKWIYHLPFLGSLENIKYCEMPLIGFIGFIPFGVECWIMWQTIRIVLDGLVEPLPDERCLL